MIDVQPSFPLPNPSLSPPTLPLPSHSPTPTIQRALSYATASRWQVVLWRLRHLVIRFFYPRTNVDRSVVFLVYVSLGVVVLMAQVGMRERESGGAGRVRVGGEL